MPLKPWTRLGRHELLETRIFKLFAELWRSPRTGQEHTFSVIASPDWTNIVALDRAGQLILIRQFRFGTGEFTIEVPGGMVDPGEHPRDTAARELREETGYRAGRIVDLGFAYPNPAIQNNKVHMFLMYDCERVGEPQLDAGEDIELFLCPLAEAERMLENGTIRHALVAVALQRMRFHLDGKLVLPA
jgi:8-oxo-dGTP pyrophosphatase MutT (NUDIX family)